HCDDWPRFGGVMSSSLRAHNWLRFVVLTLDGIKMPSVELSVCNGSLFVVNRLISSRMERVSFFPENCRNSNWLDLFALPPSALVAAPMKLAMMESADRDGKAVAHLAPHCPGLCKFDVVGVGRAPTANQ